MLGCSLAGVDVVFVTTQCDEDIAAIGQLLVVGSGLWTGMLCWFGEVKDVVLSGEEEEEEDVVVITAAEWSEMKKGNEQIAFCGGGKGLVSSDKLLRSENPQVRSSDMAKGELKEERLLQGHHQSVRLESEQSQE